MRNASSQHGEPENKQQKFWWPHAKTPGHAHATDRWPPAFKALLVDNSFKLHLNAFKLFELSLFNICCYWNSLRIQLHFNIAFLGKESNFLKTLHQALEEACEAADAVQANRYRFIANTYIIYLICYYRKVLQNKTWKKQFSAMPRGIRWKNKMYNLKRAVL